MCIAYDIHANDLLARMSHYSGHTSAIILLLVTINSLSYFWIISTHIYTGSTETT